ncbi:TPA: phage protein NinX family protein [Yersinia enterocolitica]
MKDYSAMSDFEINKAVAIHLGMKPFDEETGWQGLTKEPYVDVIVRGAGRLGRFNPCKNIDDAWKIIAENRINVEWHEMKDDTFKPYALSNETMIGYYDDSALRAAMIVFLMMKDRESSHV